MMDFFDGFLSVGRSNYALHETPTNEAEALATMDRWFVSEAMVYHTVARDTNPELGNAAIAKFKSDRFHKIWAFDSTCVIAESPADFLERALENNVKAIMVNPLMGRTNVARSVRLNELAGLMEARKIPLIICYRSTALDQDVIDFYELADFCNKYPNLPVISWEWRSRSNRPLFDVLALTKNLRLSLASIWQAQMVDQICESFGPNRLIFSLGLPNLDPATFHGVITYANISEADKNAIANGNIRNILSEANYD